MNSSPKLNLKKKERYFKMIAYAYEYNDNKVICEDLDLAFFSVKTYCHTCKGKLLLKVL